MRSLVVLLLLTAMPAFAEKPWETRVNLPVPVPLEMPALPTTNPFAAEVARAASVVASPLVEKFDVSVDVSGAAYIDTSGTPRRITFTTMPLPGVGAGVRAALLETDFSPARWMGSPAQTWLPFTVPMQGRIRGGEMVRLTAITPDPLAPPTADVEPVPALEADAAGLPFVAVDRLDQAPMPKRFSARVSSHEWNQQFKLLIEVGSTGKASRVVFLSCPQGLRRWLLTSIGTWSFRPALGAQGPVVSWVEIDGEVHVELSSLDASSLRVSRENPFPAAAAARAGARPPGA